MQSRREKRHGQLVYDEFSRSRPEAHNVLLTILEEGILSLPDPQHGSTYMRVHPEFRAIFTSNPEDYAGGEVRRMLTFSIDPELFDRFPALRVGAFLVANLDRVASVLVRDDLQAAWTGAAAELARRGITLDNIAKAAPIQQWRQAFAACGLKPSMHEGTVEALVRRVLTDGGIETQVPVVTLSYAISARHLAPLAAFDIDALPASTVTIRTARPNSDWFLPLGARPSDIPAKPGVVVYAADRTVLSWSFTHRDSRQTCLRAETTRAVFFSEAVVPQQAQTAADALDDLRHLLAARGAQVSAPAFADTNTPAIALRFNG